MSRLADYFVIVGYDHDKERSGSGNGKILQRFPEKDWEDVPFHQGLELFCQPGGWDLSSQRTQPTFFVSVLTDIEADRHYCACLTFHETVSMTPKKPDDVESEEDGALVQHTLMFQPKSIALISRLDYFEHFRNCLGIIYTVYIESMNVEIETLVANILGSVYVPPPGGPQVRFSIGAGDRQSLQPPLCATMPISRSTVAMLFKQLGIHNVLCLFCAAMTDSKVLFLSSSYSRLTDASTALLAILFPLKYSYVYIPVLPNALLEVLSTPTPFIMGVHSSNKSEIQELLDVIVADLDGGYISIPEHQNLPLLPDHIYNRVHQELTMVLSPDLQNADHAFPPPSQSQSIQQMLDKEIRAIFVRLFAELFMGYRSCLTIIRIHPEPVITFHKGLFLFERGLAGDDLLQKVLSGMSFNTFVQERGPPFRICDIFDEVSANIQETLLQENRKPDRMLHSIQEIAKHMYINENPNSQPYSQKIPKPCDGAYSRIHIPVFRGLDPVRVKEKINEGVAKANLKAQLQNMRQPKPQFVPHGPSPGNLTAKMNIINNNARRLEVLRTCVTNIFENKILDARKTFPAVLRSLKSRVVRNALTKELTLHASQNRAMLESQQFDLIVRLMNCALQEDACTEEHSVSTALLPLTGSFCRKLCTGVIQFAYTCVQDHPVWASMQFWQATFYSDVQKDIRSLYVPHDEHKENLDLDEAFTASPESSRKTTEGYVSLEKSALEIAAEQIRQWPNQPKSKKLEMISNEESTVYSQAIHYANRMVFMRVPLDISKGLKNMFSHEGESGSSNVSHSIGGSDSLEGESGFEEGDNTDPAGSVVRFISKFVDKVCSEGEVTPEHQKSLHQMIPGVVAMHIETLEAVNKESKRLPPIKKPKILKPSLLPGEELVLDGLRGYLIQDGREEGSGINLGGPQLLPAEGALFLTTYRVVFKGTPCDIQACEQVVIRSFPIASLIKEKKVSISSMPHIEQYLSEALQLRAATFQLMKIAFDEEVNQERIEMFRKMCNKYRYPQSIFHMFAFNGIVATATMLQTHKQKDKTATLRKLASKTFLRPASRKPGVKNKQLTRKQKYVLPVEPLVPRRATLPKPIDGTQGDSRPNSLLYEDDDDISMIDFPSGSTPSLNTPTFGRRRIISDYDERPAPVVHFDFTDLTLTHTLPTMKANSKRDLGYATLPPPEAAIDESEIEIQTNTLKPPDQMTADKMMDRPYVQDYQRLGLGTPGAGSRQKTTEPFRISDINLKYAVCRSYPALIVVPSNMTDDSIRKLAKCHRQNRFPAICWRHPRTKALLLRCSGFHGKGVMGMMKSSVQNTSTGTSTETSRSVEQEKFFHAVVANTPVGSHHNTDSLVSLNSVLTPTSETSGSPPQGHESPRRVHHGPNAIYRAMTGIRGSGGKAGNTLKGFTKWGSLRISSSGQMNSGTLNTDVGARLAQKIGAGENGADSKDGGLIPIAARKAALYVFGEKSQMKAIKSDNFPKCDFIPFEFYEVRHAKASLKKLMRACVPSTTLTDPEVSFHKLVEDAEWLPQIQNIMQLAGAAVDLMDIQGSSVMISMEDGGDFTTQVISLVQILLDPHYRTIEGFHVLVEKEWLAFGHRFTHRSNHTVAHQGSGFAPIFLQFLDAVHQVHSQFPLSFEFNQYFLKFIAYHYTSARFRTFILDSECERFEHGINDRTKSVKLDEGCVGNSGTKPTQIKSLWEYIDRIHSKSPLFYNFQYAPVRDSVLRPYSNIASLRIWEYYISEDLRTGSTYDREVVIKATEPNEENEEGPLLPSDRRILNVCYDNIPEAQLDMFQWLLEEMSHLESDLGHLPNRWKFVWDKLESPAEMQNRRASLATELVKQHGAAIHKKSTIEILTKAKEGGKSHTQPHNFEPHSYVTPTYCDYCQRILWGIVKQGYKGMNCRECGYNCHDKCQHLVPKQCGKVKMSRESSFRQSQTSMEEVIRVTPQNTPMLSGGQTGTGYYDQSWHSARVAETRTHEGYLFKRGALLKGWKQRWFVLDSTKHQLRYYESKEDTHCKGFIDLSEIESLQPATSLPGAPKKADNSAFFDLKTIRRVYNFLADSKDAADEWINKIQECL